MSATAEIDSAARTSHPRAWSEISNGNFRSIVSINRERAIMSAALHLINQPVAQAVREEVVERPLDNVTSFDQSPEQRLRRAQDYIAQLQSEISTLREKLAKTERAVTHRDTLLRNALLREQELRAELIR
jgi:septal ring factor EnvC (AmiA/AmiB activator)